MVEVFLHPSEKTRKKYHTYKGSAGCLVSHKGDYLEDQIGGSKSVDYKIGEDVQESCDEGQREDRYLKFLQGRGEE